MCPKWYIKFTRQNQPKVLEWPSFLLLGNIQIKMISKLSYYYFNHHFKRSVGRLREQWQDQCRGVNSLFINHKSWQSQCARHNTMKSSLLPLSSWSSWLQCINHLRLFLLINTYFQIPRRNISFPICYPQSMSPEICTKDSPQRKYKHFYFENFNKILCFKQIEGQLLFNTINESQSYLFLCMKWFITLEIITSI